MVVGDGSNPRPANRRLIGRRGLSVAADRWVTGYRSAIYSTPLQFSDQVMRPICAHLCRQPTQFPRKFKCQLLISSTTSAPMMVPRPLNDGMASWETPGLPPGTEPSTMTR